MTNILLFAKSHYIVYIIISTGFVCNPGLKVQLFHPIPVLFVLNVSSWCCTSVNLFPL